MAEVIRDFNGWSWDIVTKEIKNIEYNFLYQNLILLYGRKLNGLKGNITENIMKMATKKKNGIINMANYTGQMVQL